MILRHQRVFICIVVSVLPFFSSIQSCMHHHRLLLLLVEQRPVNPIKVKSRARAPISAHFQTPSIRNNSGPIDSPQIEQGWRAFAFHDLHFFRNVLFRVVNFIKVCKNNCVFVCVSFNKPNPGSKRKKKKPLPEEENERLHHRLCRQAQRAPAAPSLNTHERKN